MKRSILAIVLAACLGTGAIVAHSEPPEDSRNFNCALHGNRTCGVQVDTTPNKPGGVVWVSLTFRGDGVERGTFKRQTWR